MAKTAKKPTRKTPRKPARAAPHKPAAKKRPAPQKRSAPSGKAAEAEGKVFGVEVEPGSVETTLKRLREELQHWANKGRYTKVRFKLRGKPILPDLPMGAVLAAEALSFWWAGLLRVLLVNVGAKALLDVELVNEADAEVGRGKALLLSGELDQAMAAFRKALTMDRDCASAHLNLGIAYKLQGQREPAREWLQKAEQLDPQGPSGEEARRLLDQLSEPQPPGENPPAGA